MIDAPAILQTTRQATAVIRLTVPREEMPTVMGPAIAELMATVAAQGVGPTGPWFTHHFAMNPKTFDFEVGVPVKGPVTPTGRVSNGELPAATVARTIYRGPYYGLAGAWPKLDAWVTAQGRTPEPALWETYLTDPAANPDPSSWQTELTRPIS